MRVDLPTLGIPTTMTFTGLFMPLAALRAIFSARTVRTAGVKSPIPLRLLQSVMTTA